MGQEAATRHDMGVSNTPFICYSHSSYEDVRVLFFNQIRKLLPEAQNLLLFTDKVITPSPGVRVVLFDESLSYSERVLHCLDQLSEEVVVFHHEDMILYDRPDIDYLNHYIDVVKNSNIDYIKLLKGGEIRDVPVKGHPTLYHLPHDYALSFAIQPTVWKLDKLKEVYAGSERVGNEGVRAVGSFELLGSKYVNSSDINGAYHFDGEAKRGKNHWNSRVYPHGNFLYKGAWVYSEYRQELDNLAKVYGVSLSDRGLM